MTDMGKRNKIERRYREQCFVIPAVLDDGDNQ